MNVLKCREIKKEIKLCYTPVWKLMGINNYLLLIILWFCSVPAKCALGHTTASQMNQIEWGIFIFVLSLYKTGRQFMSNSIVVCAHVCGNEGLAVMRADLSKSYCNTNMLYVAVYLGLPGLPSSLSFFNFNLFPMLLFLYVSPLGPRQSKSQI